MKIFGHPLHLVLIHFPSALLPFEVVCSAIAFFGGPDGFLDAAFFAAVGAVVTGWLAIITGALDLVPIIKHKPQSVARGLIHGSINSTVIIVYTVIAMATYKTYPSLQMDGLPELVLKAVLVIILGVGNFLGANLILKDGVLYSKDPS